MENTSGIEPTEFKVLILPEDAKDKVLEKFEGLKDVGFEIPDDEKDRQQHAQMSGVLVAVSPLAFTYEDWPEGSKPPQVGQRVMFARYAGTRWDGTDGKEYRIVQDKDIAAILS